MAGESLGVMVQDRCSCGKRLMKNKKGNVWCSDLECNFHIRDGKRVTPKVIDDLSRESQGGKEIV
jgi:hypothetical protein